MDLVHGLMELFQDKNFLAVLMETSHCRLGGYTVTQGPEEKYWQVNCCLNGKAICLLSWLNYCAVISSSKLCNHGLSYCFRGKGFWNKLGYINLVASAQVFTFCLVGHGGLAVPEEWELHAKHMAQACHLPFVFSPLFLQRCVLQ